MSRESYTRGFCKTAQAAGIDPNALVKFAQQYKTDGWAPDSVQKLYGKDRNSVPFYTPPRVIHNGWPFYFGDAPTGVIPSKVSPVEVKYELNPAIENPAYLTDKLRLFPKFRNWHDAHLEALGKVRDVVSMVSPSDDDFDPISPDVLKVLGKVYHEGMHSLTSTPQRVSTPVNK